MTKEIIDNYESTLKDKGEDYALIYLFEILHDNLSNPDKCDDFLIEIRDYKALTIDMVIHILNALNSLNLINGNEFIEFCINKFKGCNDYEMIVNILKTYERN